jgi:predicted phage baseplate assembly protein
VDVFAWLTEQTLYRLNQVPRKNYIKFLKLLGRQAAPARPATAQVTFVPAATNKTPISVPQGFRITAQVNDGGAPLIFETSRGMDVIGTPLKAVGVYDGATLEPRTPANEQPGTAFHPFGLRPTTDSALYLGFGNPGPGANPFPQEVTLFVFLPPEATAGQAQASPAPRPEPPVSLIWEYRAASAWVRLNVYADDTAAFTREGYIRLEQPAQITPYKMDRLDPTELLWIRARIDGPPYLSGQAPRVDIIRPNTVEVANLVTDRSRILGVSTGQPNATFSLSRRPVDPPSVHIKVETDSSADEWQQEDDFLASKKDDTHFVVDASAGTIQFGDGTNGRIPPAGATITALAFRWGGGIRGNKATAGLIKDMAGSLTGIEKVANERAATGGSEEEGIDEIIKDGPTFLRRGRRAVTPEDFASFAREVGGVKNAIAIPCRHPDFPGVEVAGSVTVYIVPETTERPPKAPAELIRSVADALNDVRLLTTEVYVSSPQFMQIRVEARLEAPPYVAVDDVARRAREALDTALDPQVWQFGKPLHPSDIDRVLLAVPDVTAIQNRNIYVNGALWTAAYQPILIPDGGLLYGAGHLLIVTKGT